MEVLVVDDHPLVRDILMAVVRRALGTVQVAECGSLDEALDISFSRRIDLVLLDLGLPGCVGTDALDRFLRERPGPKVVVFSALEDEQTITSCMRRGAADYLPKTRQPEDLIAALRRAAEFKGKAPYPDLSARRQEVFDLMVKGLSNREIALRLSISENTVKHHLSAVFDSLGVSSRAEAMAAAAKPGFAWFRKVASKKK